MSRYDLNQHIDLVENVYTYTNLNCMKIQTELYDLHGRRLYEDLDNISNAIMFPSSVRRVL